MSLHNPTLRELNTAVNASRNSEAEAKKRLLSKLAEFKKQGKTEDYMVTYTLRNTGLSMQWAKYYIKIA